MSNGIVATLLNNGTENFKKVSSVLIRIADNILKLVILVILLFQNFLSTFVSISVDLIKNKKKLIHNFIAHF